MDIDDGQQSPKHTLQPTNALAGPSSTPELPSIFLPPPGPPQPRPPVRSTEDLISRVNLLQAYNKYVLPYATPVGLPSAPSTADKGKGKEKELSVPPGATPGAGADGDEDDGKGEKKSKNTYRYLIKGIPGKHSMKKDDYLTTMIQVPPKQKISIQPFDLKTQREAFSVSLEGIKGWNINTLVAETPQAREDRKKRKELKKLAKAQGQTSFTAMGASSASGLPTTPALTSMSTPAAAPSMVRGGTPKPGMAPRRPSTAAIPPQKSNPSQPRGRTPVGIGTPQSMPTPGPGSVAAGTTPAPTSVFTPSRSTPNSTPASAPAAAQPRSELGAPKRGVKREREHSGDGVQMSTAINGVGAGAEQAQANNGVNMNGGAGPKPLLVAGAKAGNAGVRPRPLKKQRKDIQGQAREMPVQQPTPHA